jgi:HlyD family secretion protein
VKKKIIFAAAGLLLVLVIVLSLIKKGDEKSVFPTLEWVAAQIKPMEETISASGEFKPHSREILSGEISGKITEIHVEEGDWVKAGQLLISLNQTDYRQSVNQAEASLESIRRSIRQTLLSYRLEYGSLEIQQKQTREKLEKQEELFKLEAITEEELKLSRDSLERAEQNLKATAEKLNLLCGLPPDSPPMLSSSRDQEIIESSPEVIQQQLLLEGARRNLERCFIRAPRNGQVVKIYPQRGALTGAGTNLIMMQGDDPMEAEVTVDEVDIGKIKVGDTALITTDSLIGKEISGQIKAISPILELFGNSRAGKVVIGMDETDLPLRSGASCVAEIRTLAREGTLTLPVTAITTSRGRVLAYRLEETDEGKTRLKEVELVTGISTIDDIEILGGIDEGDRFALPDSDIILRDGLYIIPVEKTAKEDNQVD